LANDNQPNADSAENVEDMDEELRRIIELSKQNY
jgi:hypothetical protein